MTAGPMLRAFSPLSITALSLDARELDVCAAAVASARASSRAPTFRAADTGASATAPSRKNTVEKFIREERIELPLSWISSAVPSPHARRYHRRPLHDQKTGRQQRILRISAGDISGGDG